MSNNEILEGNKLIAEFVKVEFPARYAEHEYHKNWNWLMPVIEKIHLKKCVKEISISPGRTTIWLINDIKKTFIQSPFSPFNNSITECWIAVVEFIKWYDAVVKTKS